IAYGDRMKHAKDDKITAHPVLGPSAWWHVVGQALGGTKYIDAQGTYLLHRLIALYGHGFAEHGANMPKVFVITPFREVKEGLVALLGKKETWEQALAGKQLPVPENLNEWSRASIGTVHTFQGKEADIVFFVLGCDETRRGAIDWATSKPNLLNVAVTRAKKHVYILGDQRLWGTRAYFDIADGMLAKIEQPPASSDHHEVLMPT
uniref:AAA domain-containing protein n=1 Tax=Dyella silvatica TaxID=2992128 RepID=UPI00225B00CF